VLRTLDSKVHPSCIHGLKHFFGRSGMAVCNENLSSGVVVVKSAKDGVWSKHRVLRLEPQLRLERRGQDGQRETEKPDHPASLGVSITSATRIRFSVHTGLRKRAILLRSSLPM
jgi:hypothetical protein